MSENILTRALEILQAVAVGGPRRFGELRDTFGVNATTLAKILKILTERGFLEKSTEGYTVGDSLRALADGRWLDALLIESAREPLRAVSERWGVTALLIVHEGRRTRFLDKVAQEASIYGRPVGQWFAQSAALPWDLHRMLRLDKREAASLLSEANAFWEDRNQGSYTEEAWRGILDDAENPAGCLSLSPGFPCEARGAVPVEGKDNQGILAYLGFIAIVDRREGYSRKLRELMRGLQNEAHCIEEQLAAHHRLLSSSTS